MKDLKLTFDQRKIVQAQIPIKLDTPQQRKNFYRGAALLLAEQLISNNAIRFDSDFDIYSNKKVLRFWLMTYEKKPDWSNL